MKRKQLASDGSIADRTERNKKKVARPAVHKNTPQSPESHAQQPGGHPLLMAEQGKQRKKQKRKDKQQDTDPDLAASEHAAPAVPEPAQANGVHSPDTGGKKRKKQKQAAQQQASDAADIDGSAAVPKSKARTAKAAVDTGSAAMRAVVGDQELADSLPPIVKHLYQEAPSVAALTAAEVDSWRLERATGIKGCDLHPVMTFKDAGALVGQQSQHGMRCEQTCSRGVAAALQYCIKPLPAVLLFHQAPHQVVPDSGLEVQDSLHPCWL